MDDDRLVLPVRRHSAWRALGIRRSRLGRLLGVGSCRKRFAAPLAYRHGFFALRDDAGKARHDEGLERLAGLLHLPALHSWHLPYSQRHCQFRSRVCEFAHWSVVCKLPCPYAACLLRRLYQESRLSEERKSARLDDLPRIQLPL